MASDRDEGFKQAERMLRQGKIDAAVSQLDGLVKGAPRDLLLLNRCGDLLAKSSQRARAIPFYERLADQYAQGGFLPKAIAIYKKALKLDADRAQLLGKIGELYMTLEHAGEARSYLLRAAERYLNDRNLVAAREVYKRLVAAEPDDPRHRVRLAETRAVEGETELAGKELIALGDSLLDSDRPVEAERAYQRAAELLKKPFEASAGRAFSLARQKRLVEALEAVSVAAPAATPGAVAGLRAAVLEAGGRSEDTVGALRDGSPGETYESFLRWMRKGPGGPDLEAAWERIDAAMEPQGVTHELIDVLARLGDIEENGHLPALQRLYALRRGQGDARETARVLERLIGALRARSMDGEAKRRLDELCAIAPHSELVAANAAPSSPSPPQRRPVVAAPPAPKPVPRAASPAAPAISRAESEWAEAEAPAVPLAPADEEFVRGHLTEAEVLQKYGLASEALQRLRTVTGRFPGHVEAQVKLVSLLRSQGGKAELTEVLFRLAVARRAAGDAGAAREAAAEAAGRPGLSEGQRAILQRMGLIAAPAPAPVPAAASARPAIPRAAPAPAPGIAPHPEAPLAVDTEVESEDEIEIVFGSEADDESASEIRAPARQVASGHHAPLQEVLPDAPSRSDAARGDGDLADLTAALESDLADPGTATDGPEAGEESLEDVFAAFKRQVEDEVGSEDYRTHYDLGIAYKEMGLLGDALREFEIATSSPELFREACSMLALCQRQRGDIDEAVRWYEKALEAPGASPDEIHGLRYDLADALVQQGEDQAALDLFQNILDSDPGYRDVQSRISDLRARRDS